VGRLGSMEAKYIVVPAGAMVVILFALWMNLKFVMPADLSAHAHWGLRWPPFVGRGDVEISDGMLEASIALMVIASLILAVALLTSTAERFWYMLRGLLGRRN
jgi:hypothetical protein